MKHLRGKLLDFLLLLMCIMLFILLIPSWLTLVLVSVGLVLCIWAIVKTTFF